MYHRENGFQWLWLIGFLMKARVSQLLQQVTRGMSYGFQSWKKLTQNCMVPMKLWKGVQYMMHLLTWLEVREKKLTCFMNLHSWILWVGIFGSNCKYSNKKGFCLGLTVFQVLMSMFHQVESCKAMDTPCCRLEWFDCRPCGVPQDLLCSSSLCLCYHWIIFFIGVYEVCLWGVYWVSFLLFQV